MREPRLRPVCASWPRRSRSSPLAGCAVGPNYQRAGGSARSGLRQRRPPANAPGARRRHRRPSGAASATRRCRSWSSVRSPPTATSASPGAAAGSAGDAAGRATPSCCPRSAWPPTPRRSLTPEFQLPGPRAASAPAAPSTPASPPTGSSTSSAATAALSESAAAQVDASVAGVHAAQTAVAAEVARNYLELRGLQQRFEVANESLVNQRDTLRLTTARLDAGRGTRLDVVARAKPVRQHRGDPAGAAGGDRPRRLSPGDADGAVAARRRRAARARRSCCRSCR